ATISKLENGRVPNPTWVTLRTYARALGLRIDANLAPVPSATPRDVEFREAASGCLCIVIPEEDWQSLCDYLSSRGIVCREQAPAEAVSAESSHRVTIALAPETDRRRVRALTHRWRIQAGAHRIQPSVIPVIE